MRQLQPTKPHETPPAINHAPAFCASALSAVIKRISGIGHGHSRAKNTPELRQPVPELPIFPANGKWLNNCAATNRPARTRPTNYLRRIRNPALLGTLTVSASALRHIGRMQAKLVKRRWRVFTMEFEFPTAPKAGYSGSAVLFHNGDQRAGSVPEFRVNQPNATVGE